MLLHVCRRSKLLCVRGERHFEEEENSEGYLRREVARGRFELAISLPEVKPEDITATYQDGIVEVVVPKAAALLERTKVPVKAVALVPRARRGGDRAAAPPPRG
jgi:HSP20 family molecular chaperone IbpA